MYSNTEFLYCLSGMFAVERFKLGFKGFEKGFRTGVVPAVPFPAHALPDTRSPLVQCGPERCRAVLYAPVGMKNQTGPQAAVHTSHGKRRDSGMLRRHVIAERPAGYLSGQTGPGPSSDTASLRRCVSRLYPKSIFHQAGKQGNPGSGWFCTPAGRDSNWWPE